MVIISLGFFCVLYFLQGAVLALIINFQKPFLAAQGVSREHIALLTSSMLFPFIGKIFLGAISDRCPLGKWGKRKPYMTIGLLTTMMSYGWITQVNPGSDFSLYFVLSVLATLGLALFDTSADGFAIDSTDEPNQGFVQAAMLSGKSLGLISCSYFFGEVVQEKGIQWVFAGLSLMTIPVLLAVWFFKSPVRKQASKTSENGFPTHLIFSTFFALFALYGIFYSITSFGIDGILTLFMDQELHASSQQIGQFGSVRGGGALIGAVAAGWALSRWKKEWIAYLSLFTLMAAGFVSSYMTLDQFWLFAIIWGAAWGFQETTYVTLSMNIAVGKWSATLFAFLMMFSNLGTSVGEGITTTLSAQYPIALVIRGLSALLSLSLLLLVLKNRLLVTSLFTKT